MYLYHRRPNEMSDTILRPLSGLPPEFQTRALTKYEPNRKHFPEQQIGILGCKRKDVLWLTAVAPQKFKETLGSLGRKFSGKYFRVPVSLLIPSETAVLLYKAGTFEPCFDTFYPNNIEDYAEMPNSTRRYYHECEARGEAPFLHHGLVQVVYRGTICASDCSVVEV